MHSLTSNNKIIGTLEETIESTKDMGNQLLKFITLYNVAGINLNVLDNKANLIGII
jgi:endo-alpha-1,4-polygalactosaminidase (GH114 family)